MRRAFLLDMDSSIKVVKKEFSRLIQLMSIEVADTIDCFLLTTFMSVAKIDVDFIITTV